MLFFKLFDDISKLFQEVRNSCQKVVHLEEFKPLQNNSRRTADRLEYYLNVRILDENV